MGVVTWVARIWSGQRQIVSNVAWQTVAQLVARMLNLVVFFLVANALGAGGLGRFAFAMTFAQAVGVFIDFGMQPILVREAVKSDGWGLFKSFSRLKLVLAVSIGPAAVAAGSLVFGYRGSDTLGVALAVAAIGCLSFLNLLFSLVRARQEMACEAVFTFLHRLLYLVLAVLALSLWTSANGVLGAYAISGLLATALLSALVTRRYSGPARPAAPDRKVIGQILPLLLIDVCTLIYFRIDTLLLQLMRGYAEVGVYNAAYRLFEALIVVPSVLAIALFPRLVSDLASGDRPRSTWQYFASFVILGIGGAAVLCALSGPAVRLLYGGGEFAASAAILRVLLVAFVLVCVNYPLTQIAIASGRQKAYAWGVVAASVVNVGLNCLAIPRYGAMGAAAVTIATELSLFLFLQGHLREAWRRARYPLAGARA